MAGTVTQLNCQRRKSSGGRVGYRV